VYRLLVTGARVWDDYVLLYNVLDRYRDEHPDLVIVHGACPKGADDLAEEWAIYSGTPTEPYPANWNLHGKSAGHIRNKEMVDTKPDSAVAFIKGESRGTKNCLSHIQKAGIPYEIFRAE
jgi:hypothetical protein